MTPDPAFARWWASPEGGEMGSKSALYAAFAAGRQAQREEDMKVLPALMTVIDKATP